MPISPQHNDCSFPWQGPPTELRPSIDQTTDPGSSNPVFAADTWGHSAYSRATPCTSCGLNNTWSVPARDSCNWQRSPETICSSYSGSQPYCPSSDTLPFFPINGSNDVDCGVLKDSFNTLRTSLDKGYPISQGFRTSFWPAKHIIDFHTDDVAVPAASAEERPLGVCEKGLFDTAVAGSTNLSHQASNLSLPTVLTSRHSISPPQVTTWCELPASQSFHTQVPPLATSKKPSKPKLVCHDCPHELFLKQWQLR